MPELESVEEETKVRQPISRYISASKKLDLTGIDWSEVKKHPLDEATIRCLTYMMDVEGYTVVYLRDILNTSAIDDPEIARFLTIWAYEEMFHSEAIEKFLAEAGVSFKNERRAELRKSERFLDRVSMWMLSTASRFSSDIFAIHLSFGAIHELTTLQGYRLVAERAKHPVLSEILRRIIKDERRHFSFYFWQAKRRLAERPFARFITSFAVKRFFKPVGDGVKADAETREMVAYLSEAPGGRETARHIDETIQELPGLEWFKGLESYLNATVAPLPVATAPAT